MNDFALNFKYLRKEKKYTQEKMAVVLDVSKSTIAMWETGKRMPGYEMLESIADFFNVDMSYLLGKQDVKKIISIENDYLYNSSCIPNEIIEELSKLDERKQVLVLAYLKAINGEV